MRILFAIILAWINTASANELFRYEQNGRVITVNEIQDAQVSILRITDNQGVRNWESAREREGGESIFDSKEWSRHGHSEKSIDIEIGKFWQWEKFNKLNFQARALAGDFLGRYLKERPLLKAHLLRGRNPELVENPLHAYLDNPASETLCTPVAECEEMKGLMDKGTLANHYSTDHIFEKPTLLITHAQEKWNGDCYQDALAGIVSQAKRLGMETVGLISEEFPEPSHWVGDLDLDHVLYSANGEHNAIIKTNKVVAVGGYYSRCFATSLLSAVTTHFQISEEPLQIYVPTHAVLEGRGEKFADDADVPCVLSDMDEGVLLNWSDYVASAMWVSKDDLRTVTYHGYEISTQGTGPRKITLHLLNQEELNAVFPTLAPRARSKRSK